MVNDLTQRFKWFEFLLSDSDHLSNVASNILELRPFSGYGRQVLEGIASRLGMEIGRLLGAKLTRAKAGQGVQQGACNSQWSKRRELTEPCSKTRDLTVSKPIFEEK